jgi:hypothetical protein
MNVVSEINTLKGKTNNVAVSGNDITLNNVHSINSNFKLYKNYVSQSFAKVIGGNVTIGTIQVSGQEVVKHTPRQE